MISPAVLSAIGMAAGCCTTFSFIPQVIKVWRQGGRDLSYGMLSLFFAGCVLWLAYGLILGALAIILANAVTGVLVAIAALFKYLAERKERGTVLVKSDINEGSRDAI